MSKGSGASLLDVDLYNRTLPKITHLISSKTSREDSNERRDSGKFTVTFPIRLDHPQWHLDFPINQFLNTQHVFHVRPRHKAWLWPWDF
jgi:hypothetical protein